MSDRGLIRPHHSKFERLFKVSDLTTIAALYILCCDITLDGWNSDDSLAVLIAAVAYYFAAISNDVYKSWRIAHISLELKRVFISWVIGFLCVLIAALLFGILDEKSRTDILSWAALTAVVLVGWHAGLRLVSRKVRSRGKNSRRAAIIGATPTGLELANHIAASPWMGINLLGFYDDRSPDSAKQNRKDDNQRIEEIGPHAYMGNIEAALAAARDGDIDLVFVALPFLAENRVREIVNEFSDTTASIFYAHDYSAFDLLTGRLFMLGDTLVMSLRETPFFGLDALMKRIEDIILSTAILLVVAAPCLLISIGVKVTSPGPVLFKQKRYGLNGAPITVWKFRTMTVQQDGDDIPQARKDDDRVTPFGRFLRRTSLDELPQFVNVLMGDMSVVGPRPHAVAHNEKYRKLIKSYMFRHTIKPGITGWAQVNGYRGETDTPEKMKKRIEYDLEYIRRWSVFFDLKIVWLTILRGFNDKNAY